MMAVSLNKVARCLIKRSLKRRIVRAFKGLQKSTLTASSEFSTEPGVRRHIKWHGLWTRLRETLLISLVDV